MKNQFTSYPVMIHELVSRLSEGSMPFAISQHSLIVNDVPRELELNADENMVASILGSLLNTLITQTKNCCIRISAKQYGKIALLSLKESHSAGNRAFNGNIRQYQQLAEKVGGTVSISSHREKETTIIFSFITGSTIAA